MRIIVADDEINVRNGIVSLIADVAPDARIVGLAQTVDEVVDLVKIHFPDLVMIDIRMPGGTGLDAVARTDHDSLPLWIVVTSYPEFEYARRAIALSVFDYLLKPVSEEEMQRTLNLARAEVGKRIRERAGRLTSAVNTASESAEHDIAVLAKRHIASQYGRPIGVAQIADQLGVTPNYLSTVFRQRHGETPLDFLTRVRMEEAAKLLCLGYGVAETAALVGFHDVRHFSKRFTKHWGVRPSEYKDDPSR